MYEPLLQVMIPDSLARSLRGPATSLEEWTRKIVIVAQAWLEGDAEYNTAHIVQHLLRSGKVGLLAFGDYGTTFQFRPPPPAIMPLAERQQLAEQAELLLVRHLISVPDYISVVLNPDVPMLGVNDEALLTMGQEARTRRLETMKAFSAQDGHVPILGTLCAYLEQVRDRCFSAEYRKIEWLLEQIKEESRLGFLPPLLKVAIAAKVNMDNYPSLTKLNKIIATGYNLNPWQSGRERAWLLRNAVLTRLAGGKVDPYGGLKALFMAEMRQIVYSGEDEKHLLQSERPLFHCSEATIVELLKRIAEGIEQNEPSGISAAKPMLDLAAIFGLNDRHYAQFRTLIATQNEYHSEFLRVFHEELQDLEAELLSIFVSSKKEEDKGKEEEDKGESILHRLGQRLTELEKLAQERLSVEDAQRVVHKPPSAAEIARGLQDFRVTFTQQEEQDIERFDQECLPAALQFQESSLAQVKAMATNMLDAMSEYNSETAVLVCGGFYPSGIALELERSEQAVCSIIQPQLHYQPEAQKLVSPQEIREKAHTSRISFRFYGGFRDRLQEMRQKQEKNTHAGDDGHNQAEQASTAYQPSDGSPNAQAWSQQHYQQAVVEWAIAKIGREAMKGPLHECRVCHRRAPIEDRAIICSPGHAPELVLECQSCADFVCTRCSGYGSVQLFPGNMRKRGRSSDSEAAILVCNIHGEPLGDKHAPRIFGGKLPGHSLFV